MQRNGLALTVTLSHLVRQWEVLSVFIIHRCWSGLKTALHQHPRLLWFTSDRALPYPKLRLSLFSQWLEPSGPRICVLWAAACLEGSSEQLHWLNSHVLPRVLRAHMAFLWVGLKKTQIKALGSGVLACPCFILRTLTLVPPGSHTSALFPVPFTTASCFTVVTVTSTSYGVQWSEPEK